MILRLLLGDQLNLNHSWFEKVDDSVCYVIMEVQQETNYVKHHIQKVIAFFNAMRQFKTDLEQRGHRVHYIELNDKTNSQSLTKNLLHLIDVYQARVFEYQYPDEYRLDKQLEDFCKTLSIRTNTIDTEHFMTSRTFLSSFFEGKKQLVMEYFYRRIRKDFNLLMEGENPLGGAWNFDKNNRNKWKGSPIIPKAYRVDSSNLDSLTTMLREEEVTTLGTIDSTSFLYPASRKEALLQLEYFNKNLLRYFGFYQDAMHTEEVNLFHSRLSFALNTKMVTPLEVVQSVIDYHHQNEDEIDISQVEGFVRQIIGWREYMRGIYWREMPAYGQKNALDNHNTLPNFYWTGETNMNCLKQSIKNSLDHAYAHHIQRLMILGNFALLAGIDPAAVNAWYLAVYADAYEWVEMPNVSGMTLYADGGDLASKPYAASGAYISRMSDYCKGCRYKVKEKLGKDACPFNYLYWDFLIRNADHLSGNPRMGMPYRNLARMDDDRKAQITEQSTQFLDSLSLTK